MARGRGERRLRWLLGLTGVVVVVLLAHTGNQARQAREDLEVAAEHLEQIAAELKAGDTAAAHATLQDVQQAAADAAGHVQGPGWWLTSRLPGISDDVAAVRTVTDVTDRLATQVLPGVVSASAKLDPASLRPSDGQVAIQPLAEVAAELVAANEKMQRQADRVASLEPARLNGQLAEPVALMQRRLREASSLSANAARAVRLLPTMLGAEGKRTYLVLFQNNAEIRSTGGIPGAFAVITAEGGEITLERVGSASSLGRLAEPALPLTDREIALYGEKLALFPQNLNLTPDFPRTAELAAAMWHQQTGTRFDGVVSVDPVALSYLLEGTGPVELPSGRRLTADNAVPLLLSEVYRDKRAPAAQDAFFAAAARAGFEQLTSAAGDPAEVLAGLARAAGEGRIHVWSAHADEQELLAETALGGRIPREPGEERPFVGVFLNDGTGAKMQYYLDHHVDVDPVGCNIAGRQELHVTLTLTSGAPQDVASLPPYVVGMARELGVEPGSMRVSTHLYAPIGGWIESSAVDGNEVPLSKLEHLEHPVGSRTVEIDPGETRVLTYTVMTGLDQPGRVDLRVTPGVRDSGVGHVGRPACSPS